MSTVVIVMLVTIGVAILLAIPLLSAGREHVAIPVQTFPPVVSEKGTLQQTVYRLDPDFDGIEYVMASALQTRGEERVRLYEVYPVTDRPGAVFYQARSPEPLLTVRHTLDHGAAISELGGYAVASGG